MNGGRKLGPSPSNNRRRPRIVKRRLPMFPVGKFGKHNERVDARLERSIDPILDDVFDGRPTCALDVADDDAITLEQVGQALDLTRERIRQIELVALARMRAACIEHGLEPAELVGVAA